MIHILQFSSNFTLGYIDKPFHPVMKAAGCDFALFIDSLTQQFFRLHWHIQVAYNIARNSCRITEEHISFYK